MKMLDQTTMAPARPQMRSKLLGKYKIMQASGQKINALVPLEILDLLNSSEWSASHADQIYRRN